MIEFFRKLLPAKNHHENVTEICSNKEHKHMEKSLNDKDWVVRHAAVKSKCFGPEYMEIAFSDEHWRVRAAAVNSKHFGPEHMNIALSDEYWPVRYAAVNSVHFGPEHMDIALRDEAGDVRCAAVRSKHFEAKHFDKAFGDKDWYVRLAAVESELFPTYKASELDLRLLIRDSANDAATLRCVSKSHSFTKDLIPLVLNFLSVNEIKDLVKRGVVQEIEMVKLLNTKGIQLKGDIMSREEAIKYIDDLRAKGILISYSDEDIKKVMKSNREAEVD